MLLTCYNDPLGDDMRSRLPDDRDLVVGSFFDVALAMEGLPPLEVPDDADRTFWDTIAIGHLHSHWRDVTERFDTIVIDEAQDFSPAWIAQLTQLLEPLGPRRMLMVADEAQSLYPRGFTLPSVDDGWTRCRLVNNCRNTFDIASMLCRQLGGAPAPVGGPESVGVEWVEADETEAVVKSVGDQIDRIEGEGHEPPRVLVATFSTQLRDRLRAAYAFVPWEGGAVDRDHLRERPSGERARVRLRHPRRHRGGRRHRRTALRRCQPSHRRTDRGRPSSHRRAPRPRFDPLAPSRFSDRTRSGGVRN